MFQTFCDTFCITVLKVEETPKMKKKNKLVKLLKINLQKWMNSWIILEKLSIDFFVVDNFSLEN